MKEKIKKYINNEEDIKKILLDMNYTICIEVRDTEEKLVEVIYKLTIYEYIIYDNITTYRLNYSQLLNYLYRCKHNIEIKKIENNLIEELLHDINIYTYRLFNS